PLGHRAPERVVLVAQRPSFSRWLRTTGQVTESEFMKLNDEWSRVKPGSADHKVYTTRPTTWDMFLASKFPRKMLAYQAFLRLTGAIK
ncbi:hypothetical protein V6O07_19810, partial [Arthrospira platensis SPKY2]